MTSFYNIISMACIFAAFIISVILKNHIKPDYISFKNQAKYRMIPFNYLDKKGQLLKKIFYILVVIGVLFLFLAGLDNK